jgi:uncharacterized protein (TIGR02145 family)
MTITVTPGIVPEFALVAPLCAGSIIDALPATSINGITGTWLPAFNNSETTTYTFTPNEGQCAATITQTITITAPKVTSQISFEKPAVTVADLPNVTIGTQVWTTKNLDVSTYRDGTPIPQVTDPTAWANLTTGAWCYYNNDPANGAVYCKLYNWYAVAGIHDNDPNTPNKVLGQTGWHVPSDAEWTTLTSFLGGENVAGGKMKEVGTSLWLKPNGEATNSSGFSGLPGGYRFYGGSFNPSGVFGYWWSSTATDNSSAWYRFLYYEYGGCGGSPLLKNYGYSVRLIKD